MAVQTLTQNCITTISKMIDTLPVELQEDIISQSSEQVKINIRSDILQKIKNDLLFHVPYRMREILWNETNQININLSQSETTEGIIKEIIETLAKECAFVASKIIKETQATIAFEKSYYNNNNFYNDEIEYEDDEDDYNNNCNDDTY